jgi:hypothetical protein
MKSSSCTLSPRMFWISHIRSSHHRDRTCSEPFTCQFCEVDLSRLKEERRQAHYEDHLSNQSSASGPETAQDSQSDEKNAFWRPSFETMPPSNFTPNLIPLLKKALTISHQNGVTRNAALCYNKSVHVGVERWDLTWGSSRSGFASCERGPNYMIFLFATRLRVCGLGHVYLM